MFDFWNYWIPSIFMGAGIGVDVALATLARFNDPNLSFRKWTLPIAATHIVFPAASYYAFYTLGARSQFLFVLLGVIGAFLVAAFLYEAFCGWIGSRPLFAISEATFAWVREHLSLALPPATFPILAVSWDALWSGGAKAAQAQSGGWSSNEVLFSFGIAGLVVAFVAQGALIATTLVRKTVSRRMATFAAGSVMGLYAEAAIIGAFGLMSAWNAGASLWGLSHLETCLAISALFWLAIFLSFRKSLYRGRLAQFATEANDGVTQ